MAGSAAQLSGYIIAFAGAARVAQAAMSTGADPMTIAEYSFEINITADFTLGSETDVSLNIWRVSIKEKITTEYKSHWGITVKCLIKPSYTIEGTAG